MGQIRPLFVYFRSFHNANIAQIDCNDKSVDGVLGTQTRGGRMVGTDKSTELWRLLFPLPLQIYTYHYTLVQ